MIYVKFRETSNGTEYWNKDLKRIELFAPGTAPVDIQTEGMIGQYSANGKIAEVATIKQVVAEDLKEIAEQVISTADMVVNQTDLTMSEMDVEALRAFAKQHGIDVPGNMKKEETIRQYIIEEFNQMDEGQ